MTCYFNRMLNVKPDLGTDVESESLFHFLQHFDGASRQFLFSYDE